jgi:hypothetical protein
MQLVKISFLKFHRRRIPVVSTRCSLRLARVGVKIPQDGNRTNGYGHVVMVPGHNIKNITRNVTPSHSI